MPLGIPEGQVHAHASWYEMPSGMGMNMSGTYLTRAFQQCGNPNLTYACKHAYDPCLHVRLHIHVHTHVYTQRVAIALGQ